MSLLFGAIILCGAVGLYQVGRMEGYIQGLNRYALQRREAVDQHRQWLLTHLPGQIDEQAAGERWWEGGGTGQKGSL